MLDHFETIDDIEWLLAEILKKILIRRKGFKSAGWTGLTRKENATFRHVDAHDSTTAFSNFRSNRTVTATYIQHARAPYEVRAEVKEYRKETFVTLIEFGVLVLAWNDSLIRTSHGDVRRSHRTCNRRR